MAAFQLKKTKPTCPSCGKLLDGVSAMDGSERQPQPGDLSICFYCATYLQYEDGLALKVFPPEALLDLPDETRLSLTRARKLILRVRR